jgi:hypothetical protein
MPLPRASSATSGESEPFCRLCESWPSQAPDSYFKRGSPRESGFRSHPLSRPDLVPGDEEESTKDRTFWFIQSQYFGRRETKAVRLVRHVCFDMPE